MPIKQEKGGMKQLMKTRWLVGGCFCVLNFAFCISTAAFEGRIHAVMTRGNETNALLYTVGTNFLRVEMTATNWPNPVDIVDRNSGAVTLLFPHNRSFVRLKPPAENSSMPPGFRQMPGGVPPVAGAQPQPPGMQVMPGGLPPRVGPQAQPPA